MFINVSNHPSALWCEAQRKAAGAYGEIVDFPFPAVEPHASEEQVAWEGELIVKEILKKSPDAVLCQGEFSMTFYIVQGLMAAGIPTLCACSERRTKEYTDDAGRTQKECEFAFAGFRPYIKREEKDI